MNVLQRGVRSVLRKPIKSIILLFIVIVMSGLFLGAMASRSASIYKQDATRQAIGATFRIEGNEENRRKRLDRQWMYWVIGRAVMEELLING